MENVRKHKNIELVHTKKRMRKLSAKTNYKSSKIFSEDLVAVEMKRIKVTLNKPSYCGMAILELSKMFMYEFFYNYLKPKYGNNIQLQMSDTDSLLFYCECEDIYSDMGESLDLFDTSDFPKDHVLHSNHNKKVLGKMKDECNGVPITSFVGLRSKMYAFKCINSEHKRAKGVGRLCVKKDMTFQMYVDTLFNEVSKISTMTSIRSHLHELYCENISKIGLSAFDDKRYLINAIESYAYGHYKISENDGDNEHN